MADILQMTFSNAFTSKKFIFDIANKDKFCILIQIWLKYIPKGPIDNKLALAQVMAISHCMKQCWQISSPLMVSLGLSE